jgi:regulator of chromosome condensation
MLQAARLESSSEIADTGLAGTYDRSVKRKASFIAEPPQSKRWKKDETRLLHSEQVQVTVPYNKVSTSTPITSAITVAPPTVYLNPLPRPRSSVRPAYTLFFWGTGDEGQFGIGDDLLHEIGEPKVHPWVEQHVHLGTFGGDGAGLEAVVAGGMHTLFLDETGTVRMNQGIK